MFLRSIFWWYAFFTELTKQNVPDSVKVGDFNERFLTKRQKPSKIIWQLAFSPFSWKDFWPLIKQERLLSTFITKLIHIVIFQQQSKTFEIPYPSNTYQPFLSFARVWNLNFAEKLENENKQSLEIYSIDESTITNLQKNGCYGTYQKSIWSLRLVINTILHSCFVHTLPTYIYFQSC